MKAWYGTREASKCWGNEVTDTLIKEGCKPVVVVSMMFVPESHGKVTVCHGDDFVSCGCGAALDEIDRALTTHFDTKILPRMGTDSVWRGVGRKTPGQDKSDGALKFSSGSRTADTLKTQWD